MHFQLDSLLNLPGITVETCSNLEDHICLKLQVLSFGINCPHCQKSTEELHQDRPFSRHYRYDSIVVINNQNLFH